MDHNKPSNTGGTQQPYSKNQNTQQKKPGSGMPTGSTGGYTGGNQQKGGNTNTGSNRGTTGSNDWTKK